MDDKPLKGATQEFKDKLRRQLTRRVYMDTIACATQIISRLPRDFPLGTRTAGLMLAAIAMSESAPFAKALITEAGHDDTDRTS